MAVTVGVGAAVLTQLNTPVRTDVGARGEGTGSFPVVEIAGLDSSGDGFDPLTRALQAKGVTVLDFDASRSGVQQMTWAPAAGTAHPRIRGLSAVASLF